VKDPVWGVIVDYRAERAVGGGVPTLWDGWYADRADAEQMRDHFEEKFPTAKVWLVLQADDE